MAASKTYRKVERLKKLREKRRNLLQKVVVIENEMTTLFGKCKGAEMMAWTQFLREEADNS